MYFCVVYIFQFADNRDGSKEAKMGIKLPQICYGPIKTWGPGSEPLISPKACRPEKKDKFWISNSLKYTFYISGTIGIVSLVIFVYLLDREMGVGHSIRAAECAQTRIFAERVATSKFVEYDQLRQKTAKDLASCMNEGL